MAINPMIALAGQPVDIAGAVFEGQQHANEMAMAPIQRAAMQQQVNAQEQATQQQLMQNQAMGANYALQTAQHLKTLPMEQRLPVAQMAYAKLKAMGIGDGVADENDLTDEALDNDVNSLTGVVQGYRQQFASRSGLQTVGGVVYTKENGKTYANVQVFNQNDPSAPITTQRAEVMGDMTVAGGETPEQKRLREAEAQLSLEQQKQLLQTQQELLRLQQSIDPKARIAGAEADAKTTATAASGKVATNIELGANAIAAVPKLKEIKGLLESGKVKTGGLQAVKQEWAAKLGVPLKDAADYAQFDSMVYQELARLLQQATGVQTDRDTQTALKSAFNDQRGVAANIRLIERAIDEGERNIRFGRQAYSENKDAYRSAYGPYYEQLKPPKVETETPRDETPETETPHDKWFRQ